MKLTMLSHASVLLEDGPVSLCTDPWFSGEAFNESWSLLCKPALGPTALEGVTHIWISHEHPDHLHFPTLKSIPPEHRARMTVLYQKHLSPRIGKVLANFGFGRVLELPLARWCDLGGDVSVMCCSVGSIDSLLAVRSRGVTVLNTNDCVMGPLASRAMAKRVGPVDVFLTQFSIATRVGNQGDVHVTAPNRIIDQMRSYVEAFRPKITIPFANFVYFSHSENRYMNAWVNTPLHTHRRMQGAPTQFKFLYNGDSWSSQDGFCLNGDPLKRYQADFEKIPDLPYRSHPSYQLDELLLLGSKLASRVRLSFPKLLLRKVAPVWIYVEDLGSAVCFDLRRGTVETDERMRSRCDIALNSQALWYAFKYPWGLSTLQVSGRYQLISPKVKHFAFYLCMLSGSGLDFKGIRQQLWKRRLWSFLWSKRDEILGRLLPWGKESSCSPRSHKDPDKLQGLSGA